MKPQPPPHVPGNTEAERMDNAVRKMFSVSKVDALKETRAKHRKKADEGQNASFVLSRRY